MDINITEKIIENLKKNRDPYPNWSLKDYYVERHKFDYLANDVIFSEDIEICSEVIQGIPVEYLKINNGEELIFFIHGGGFTSGSVLSRREMIGSLTIAAKINSISVDYSLAPEKPFPSGLMDCVAVYNRLLKSGHLAKNIYIFGESAGGSLALSLIHYLIKNEIELPATVSLFSPITDLSVSKQSIESRSKHEILLPNNILEEIKEVYCYGEDLKNPYISPIFGDFKGFPPVMINVGTEEMFYEDSINLYKKLKNKNVNVKLKIWEGMFHCFLIMPIPESFEAYNEIAKFINESRAKKND